MHLESQCSWKRSHKQETGRTKDSGMWSPHWDSPPLQRTITVSLYSVDGIKPCLFPASIILTPGLNAPLAVPLTCLCSLLPAAPLSQRCGHNTMKESRCSSFVPLLHWTTNLWNTWIGCQPTRVIKVILKLQLWKVFKKKKRLLPIIKKSAGRCCLCLFSTSNKVQQLKKVLK